MRAIKHIAEWEPKDSVCCVRSFLRFAERASVRGYCLTVLPVLPSVLRHVMIVRVGVIGKVALDTWIRGRYGRRKYPLDIRDDAAVRSPVVARREVRSIRWHRLWERDNYS